jgi:DNA gyrase subunit A
MLVTNRGQTIRTRVDEIRMTGRNAQGVRVMNVEADERVVAIEPVGERDDDDVLPTSSEKLEAAAPDGEESTQTDEALDASTANGRAHDDDLLAEDTGSDDSAESDSDDSDEKDSDDDET